MSTPTSVEVIKCEIEKLAPVEVQELSIWLTDYCLKRAIPLRDERTGDVIPLRGGGQRWYECPSGANLG